MEYDFPGYKPQTIGDIAMQIHHYNKVIKEWQHKVDNLKTELEDLRFLKRLATHALYSLNGIIQEREWDLKGWKAHIRDYKGMIRYAKEKIEELKAKGQ